MGGQVDMMAAEQPAPRIPWWLPPITEENADLPGHQDMDLYDIYTLLPLNLHVANDASCENTSEIISEVVSSPGWYCMHCGKLNVQSCLWYQKCGECQVCHIILFTTSVYCN